MSNIKTKTVQVKYTLTEEFKFTCPHCKRIHIVHNESINDCKEKCMEAFSILKETGSYELKYCKCGETFIASI